MKIIVGLGNPGEKYRLTRHNAGFLAIDDYLSDKAPINCASKFAAEICELHFGAAKALLIKPQTFMNESGRAVAELANFYKISVSNDLLVIHDDVDLPLGTVRATSSSSAAGHNGIKSLIAHLGHQDFHRLRIGVETRTERKELPTDVFVLHNFTEDQLKLMQQDVWPKLREKINEFLQK